MVELPFEQKNLAENRFQRRFLKGTDRFDLKWHFDEKDRIIKVVSNPGSWKFQYDEEIPFVLQGEFKIKAGVWHRLIKGKEDLVLEIEEI